MLWTFLRYDRWRRIVLSDEGIVLPVPFDELRAKDGTPRGPEVFLAYDRIGEVDFDREEDEISYISFKVDGALHTIVRRRLTGIEFEQVCVHIAARAGRGPASEGAEDTGAGA